MRLNRLERYKTGGTGSKMEISLPLPTSAKGMVERACPQKDCVPGRFQLEGRTLGEDGQPLRSFLERPASARRVPGQGDTTCPYCGTDADQQEFTSPEDRTYARDYVTWAAAQDAADYLNDAFEEMCRSVNAHSSRGGMFSMNMTHTRGPSRPEPRPRREDLLRDLRCSICSRRYGVYAIGLFCPDCGAPNLAVHFQREVEIIGKQVTIAREAGVGGDEELAYRLLGNGHEDVVTATETYLKHVHAFIVRCRFPAEAEDRTSKKTVGNAFQSVRRSRELLKPLGIDPYAAFSSTDLEWFTDNIEKRHVLGHNLGLADRAYADTVGAEQPGMNVRLLAEDVVRFAELAAVIVRGLEQLSEFQPPRTTVDDVTPNAPSTSDGPPPTSANPATSA